MSAQKRYPFTTIDVFTNQPFGGNPLAVFPDATGIDDEMMQTIAGEFNLSETVFIFPGSGDADADLRIFTPARELPFAGHPTVGAGLILSRQGLIGVTANFRVKAGMVAVTLVDGIATITAPQPARTLDSPAPDADTVTAALGLRSGDVEATDRAPKICSAGADFLFACAASRQALARAKPGSTDCDTVGTALVSLNDLDQGIVHMRMFAPAAGIPEDPATGGAAAGLPGYLRHIGRPTPAFVIHQGDDMGRPSRITVTISTDDAGDHVSIGGSGCVMSEGEFFL